MIPSAKLWACLTLLVVARRHHLTLCSVGYKIMEMDVMYDDTCLKVMGLHERSSLSPEDVSVIASLDSAHSAGGRCVEHKIVQMFV
jgi:hypothetical protein